MKKDKKSRQFFKNVGRGRKFEEWERSQWNSGVNTAVEFEASTQWEGKRGRVDIRLRLEEDGHTVIVEIKATNWDRLKDIVYPSPPKKPGRKEEILNDRFIQVIWREEYKV